MAPITRGGRGVGLGVWQGTVMAPITRGGRTADVHGRRHQHWRPSRAGGRLTGSAYVPRTSPPSRVTRRLHALADGLDLFGDLLVRTQVIIHAVVSDSLPVCRRMALPQSARTAAPAPPRMAQAPAAPSWGWWAWT